MMHRNHPPKSHFSKVNPRYGPQKNPAGFVMLIYGDLYLLLTSQCHLTMWGIKKYQAIFERCYGYTPKTNMTVEKNKCLKMYLLLKMVTFHCHVSLLEDIHLWTFVSCFHPHCELKTWIWFVPNASGSNLVQSQNLECTLECFNITILAHQKHTPPTSPCLCYVCLNLKSFFDAQKRPLKFQSCPTSSWKLFGKHIASGTASLKASPKQSEVEYTVAYQSHLPSLRRVQLAPEIWCLDGFSGANLLLVSGRYMAHRHIDCDFEESGVLKRSSVRKIHHPWRPSLAFLSFPNITG